MAAALAKDLSEAQAPIIARMSHVLHCLACRVHPCALLLLFVVAVPSGAQSPENSALPVALEVAPLSGVPSDGVAKLTLRNPGAATVQRVIVTSSWFTDTTATTAAATATTTLAEMAPQQTVNVEVTADPGAYTQRVVRVGAYGKETLLAVFLPPSRAPVQTPDIPPLALGASPPRLIKRVSPTYPPVAAALKHTGSVPLAISIAPSGATRDVIILSTQRHLLFLEEAAVTAVRQWEFSPADTGMEAISRTIKTSINFALPQ